MDRWVGGRRTDGATGGGVDSQMPRIDGEVGIYEGMDE